MALIKKHSTDRSPLRNIYYELKLPPMILNNCCSETTYRPHALGGSNHMSPLAHIMTETNKPYPSVFHIYRIFFASQNQNLTSRDDYKWRTRECWRAAVHPRLPGAADSSKNTRP